MIRYSKLNNDFATVFQELIDYCNLLENENNRLKESTKVNNVIGSDSKFGIINLSKVNEESIFDAIKYFNKKCPYCKSDLYDGNIRRKIEIDHFFPIAKGGQDLPWNLLPICKDCNRRKRDKFPYDYLDDLTYKECYNYLDSVLEKVSKMHADKLQREEIVCNLVNSFGCNKINNNELVLSLSKLYNISVNESFIKQEEIKKSELSPKDKFLALYAKNKKINKAKVSSELSISRETIYRWIKETEK